MVTVFKAAAGAEAPRNTNESSPIAVDRRRIEQLPGVLEQSHTGACMECNIAIITGREERLGQS